MILRDASCCNHNTFARESEKVVSFDDERFEDFYLTWNRCDWWISF